MKIERSPRTALLLAALLGALVLLATPARADGDPRTDAVPRMFPYQGELALDGRPVHATGDDALHLRFALYAAPDMEQPVYQQDIVVEVYRGHFTATIGPIGQGPDGTERNIADVIAAADDLSLGITLLGDPDDPADDIALDNRQRIHATPYALWSTTATDLGVAGRLDVGGDARIAGALRVDGPVSITPGALADGTVRAADLDPAMLGDGIIQSGATVRVDPDWLAGEIRAWVRGHCRVQLGWRNRCNNCDLEPAKHVTVQADGACVGAVGADTSCRADDTWGGVNPDGDVSTDDVFYIRMVCD
ncbi:MAG: hypothetical protein H6703_01295 [Myxococcales bacterium]|nr:hypothetical protein [Myxococcales bacterium]MCB9541067.1 hypothetical protein [Myxococcales bacterium]